MAWESTLEPLRRFLARLYPAEEDIVRIVQGAGLSLPDRVMSQKAFNSWTDILTYAANNNQVEAIIQAVRHDREQDNSEFMAAIGHWQTQQPLSHPLTEMPLDHVPNLAPLPAGSRMPLPHDPHFVGREAELLVLAAALKAGKTTAIGQVAAAPNLGGIGKTQLAAEFVHRYGQYFAGGVFWLNFSDPILVKTDIADCGQPRYLNLPLANLDLESQIGLVLAAWQSPLPRLLIFDNCEDETLLQQWRPIIGGNRVLLTGRRADWGNLAGQTIPLDSLPRQESITLLCHYRPDLVSDDPLLEAIAAELGDLPLALVLAGGCLAYDQGDAQLGSPAIFLKELQDRHLLDHPMLQGEEVTASPTPYLLHAGRAFALSYERLNAEGSSTGAVALALLARAACFAPGLPIPRSLLLASLDLPEDDPTAIDQAGQALARLLELGLLTPATVESTSDFGEAVRLHRLLAHFVRRVTPDPAAAQAAVGEAVLKAVVERQDQASHLQEMSPVRGHLHFVTDSALANEDEQAARLSIWMGYYLNQRGDYQAAQPYYERALAIREQVLGPDHPYTATSLNNLAVLLQHQGEYEAARPYYERALAIYEQVLGPEHPATLQSLNNLAVMLQNQGEYEAARPYYERILAINEQVLGPEHTETATSLTHLAALLRAQREYPAARRYYERALAINEQVLGPEHPATTQSLNSLALLLQDMGLYEAAQPYFQRALAIRERVLGPDHLDTATSLNNLALLLQNQGEYEAARPYHERALAIFEQVLGPEHPATATSLNNLAVLLKEQREYQAARPYYERALAIREQVLGPDHSDTAQSLNNLAALLQEQGEYEAARPYYKRALAIYEQVMGPDYPATKIVKRNLASLDRN